MPPQSHAVAAGIDLEEVVALEAEACEYGEPFGEECAAHHQRLRGEGDVRRVGLFLGHKHAGVDARVAEGVDEAQGDDCRAAGAV